jgi:hypothetical protein
MEITEIPHDTKPQKNDDMSQITKMRIIFISSDILFYSKHVLCSIVLCPILVIVSKHAREACLIELMIAERLYHREELSTSRVYELSIIDHSFELSEVSISSILVETEDGIAIEMISLART